MFIFSQCKHARPFHIILIVVQLIGMYGLFGAVKPINLYALVIACRSTNISNTSVSQSVLIVFNIFGPNRIVTGIN